MGISDTFGYYEIDVLSPAWASRKQHSGCRRGDDTNAACDRHIGGVDITIR